MRSGTSICRKSLGTQRLLYQCVAFFQKKFAEIRSSRKIALPFAVASRLSPALFVADFSDRRHCNCDKVQMNRVKKTGPGGLKSCVEFLRSRSSPPQWRFHLRRGRRRLKPTPMMNGGVDI